MTTAALLRWFPVETDGAFTTFTRFDPSNIEKMGINRKPLWWLRACRRAIPGRCLPGGGLMPLSHAHRQQIWKRGFNDAQINWMVVNGFLQTLTWSEVEAEWLDVFSLAKPAKTGWILITFNSKLEQPTRSLRCNDPFWDTNRERFAKTSTRRLLMTR